MTVTAENVVGRGPGVNIEGIWKQIYDSNMFSLLIVILLSYKTLQSSHVGQLHRITQ